ncbi:AfsR/SARP family transcriptional regulator, partial [Streptosporangium algeriense]
RLTVFAGGATLEAIRAVCGLPDGDTVEALTGLVDKSLVEVSGTRYRMLNTIRAFCAERLAEAGETRRTRRAHAEYFLALVARVEPRLITAEQLEFLAVLDAERDNLHAALRRATEAGETEWGTALRLLARLTTYWWLRGLRSQGAARAEELLRRIGPRPPEGLEEEYTVGVLSVVSGGPRGEFDTHLDNAVAVILAGGRPPRQPFMTVLLGMAMGIPEARTASLDDRWYGLVGADPWSRALRRFGEGITAAYAGRIDDAQDNLTVALTGFRVLGERWGTSVTLSELAKLAAWRGEAERAWALCDEALRPAGEKGRGQHRRHHRRADQFSTSFPH